MGKFLDFIGKAANVIGGVADVASQFVPGLSVVSKIATGAKGIANIANAYSQGKGQREAISNFVGDTFGKGWGGLANKAIGATEQIFKTGKSVLATSQGFKSNPLGTLQNMASGVGRIGNIVGSTAGSLGSQLNRMGATRAGSTLTGISQGIGGMRNAISAGRQAVQSTVNQYRQPVQQIASGVNSIRNALR